MTNPNQIKRELDVILDNLAEGDDGAHEIADLLDRHGEWDWDDGSEHAPSDRLAVVESTGAYWLVYRGSESDSVERFSREDDAIRAMRAQAAQITGAVA